MSKIYKAFKYIALGTVIFTVFFTLGAGLTTLWHNKDIAKVDNPEDPLAGAKRTNILILGVDARQGETHSRSDTMILASIDPELKKAAFISIPRDTRVNLPQESNTKICTANFFGGPELATKKVEEILDIKIDYYITMDFNGFSSIIDTLGGVNIDVKERMYKPSEGIDLMPGQQELNGKDALAFVRYRDYMMGDIDRTSHQQVFLKALAKEALSPLNIVKIPKLAKQLDEYTDTNMKVADMVKMALWAPSFSADSVITQTLPGYFYDERDSRGNLLNSFWIADKNIANNLLDSLFAGKTVATLVEVSPEKATKIVKYYNDEDSSKKNNATDNDDSTSKKSDQQIAEEKKWERSRLPSPGHGV